MNKLLKSALGAGALLAATTTQAAAEICILGICIGGGDDDGGGGGGAPAAPEIDVAQGLGALAILACAILLLREAYLRQRAAR